MAHHQCQKRYTCENRFVRRFGQVHCGCEYQVALDVAELLGGDSWVQPGTVEDKDTPEGEPEEATAAEKVKDSWPAQVGREDTADWERYHRPELCSCLIGTGF